MTGSVQRTVQDGIATVTLDRPEALNAIGPQLIAELATAVRASATDRPLPTASHAVEDERTAQRRHVAGEFFNDACARFLARTPGS